MHGCASSRWYLGGVRGHDPLHSEGAPRHRVPVVADVHLVRALLRGNVLHRVHLIGRAGFQLAGDWPARGGGDFHVQFALPTGATRVDGELLILSDIHFCDTHTRDTHTRTHLVIGIVCRAIKIKRGPSVKKSTT